MDGHIDLKSRELVADGRGLPNPFRFGYQRQERSLKRVLAIFFVLQATTTRGHHDRPIPAHKLPEGSLLANFGELCQQLGNRVVANSPYRSFSCI